MPHLLVRPLPFYFFSKTILFISTHSPLAICRGNIGEPTCGEFFSSTCFKSIFTKDPAIFSSSRRSNFSWNSIVPYSSRSSGFIRDGSILTSARSFKSTRDSTASPQLEASALPRTPQAPPQLITQELPLEPEKTPSPIQEDRNEVSMGIQFCYSLLTNHPQFGKPSLSGSGCITTKLFIHCG
jgi:hypothetical protein